MTNIRTSVNPSKVRFVLDSTAPIQFKATKNSLGIVVDLPDSSAKQKQITVNDKVIKGAVLEANGRKASKLVINTAKNCEYKIFSLKNPHRLVIDVYRITIIKKKESIASGVDYTFMQDEFKGRQIQAHLLEISKDAPYDLVPFSCAGSYNGRGSLAKASLSRNMLAAINSSYFDNDGWVIGSTKYNDMFISMDTTPRSTYAAHGKNRFIYKDVAYQGVVSLPGNKFAELKGMNRLRIVDDFVLYNEHFNTSTKTNQWGVEAKIKNGKVVAVSTKGNMTIEPGTYVLSAHGTSKPLLAGLKVGDKVGLNESLTNQRANQMKIAVSGGPLLLENGSINVRTAEEKIARDIALGRSPRTALGLKRDGTLMLFVVDGRNENSAGMTLNELAEYMLKLGAYDALNFDGGGSSEMCIKGKVLNHPSDGKERRVSMGLGLVRSK
ncbi:MAG: phosphodiester glycosidase family protein [Phascolarctobacterium sp.]|nr:phosphodiester glycosidase family protein [Phascolarctobacterium sp.]